MPEDEADSRRVFRQALKAAGADMRQYRIPAQKRPCPGIAGPGTDNPRRRQPRFEATIYGVFFDITKQKEIEAALRESQEHLNTIMNSVRAGMVVIDQASRRIVDMQSNTPPT